QGVGVGERAGGGERGLAELDEVAGGAGDAAGRLGQQGEDGDGAVFQGLELQADRGPALAPPRGASLPGARHGGSPSEKKRKTGRCLLGRSFSEAAVRGRGAGGACPGAAGLTPPCGDRLRTSLDRKSVV